MISPFPGINQIILYPVKTHLPPAQPLLPFLPLPIPTNENSLGMHSLTTSSTCLVDLKAPCSIRCRLHQTTTLLRIASSTAVNVLEPSPEGANSENTRSTMPKSGIAHTDPAPRSFPIRRTCAVTWRLSTGNSKDGLTTATTRRASIVAAVRKMAFHEQTITVDTCEIAENELIQTQENDLQRILWA